MQTSMGNSMKRMEMPVWTPAESEYQWNIKINDVMLWLAKNYSIWTQ